MDPIDLAALRQEYKRASLSEAEAPADPFLLLRRWIEEALSAQLLEPNAFTLATCGAAGQPHARIVLLKGLEPPYLYFYTNYESAKGRELAQNPRVAATFWWDVLERQVRVEGLAEKAPPEVSEAYFRSRPRESQIGAWVSPQSEPINRAELEARWQQFSERFRSGEVPRPPHWGGYRIRAHMIEFWQGRPNRLHDRLRYIRHTDHWHLQRLAP